MFAFEAAASGLVPHPVTCVSVASPRVGDSSFQQAFVSLESQGKLRHLRIAHAQDPVTMLPKTSSLKILALLHPMTLAGMAIYDALNTSSETYRHTGIKLRLLKGNNRKKGLYEISYQGVTTVEEEIANDHTVNEKRKEASSSSSGKNHGGLGSMFRSSSSSGDGTSRGWSFSGIPGVCPFILVPRTANI